MEGNAKLIFIWVVHKLTQLPFLNDPKCVEISNPEILTDELHLAVKNGFLTEASVDFQKEIPDSDQNLILTEGGPPA